MVSQETLEWGVHIVPPKYAECECKHYYTCPMCDFHYTDYISSPVKEECPRCGVKLVLPKHYTGSRNKVLKER